MQSQFSKKLRACGLVGSFLLAACAVDTGSGSLDFEAYAAGPKQMAGAESYLFTTVSGYEVELSRASLRVGAIYLNQQRPLPGSPKQACFLPGMYVAEVTSGVTVDLLSSELQAFGASGSGLLERAYTAQIWLLGEGADIDALNDTAVIFDAAGIARRGAEEWPFEASLTIGAQRRQTPADPKKPGDNPICAERIVSPIPVNLKPSEGDRLVLRIDPAVFFRQVKFEELSQVQAEPPLYRFRDESEGQPSLNLYRGLHSTRSAYQFSWEPASAQR